MTKTISVWLASSLMAGAWPALADGNAQAGEARSAVCSACHGLNGISGNDLWPNLAGQKAAYIVKQLKAYSDGTRTDPLMDAIAKSLTQADMENLAAYYSQLSAK
jgi:cytochrome c553